MRVFLPKTAPNMLDSSFYGFNLPVKSNREYFLDIILYNLALATSKGVILPININTFRLVWAEITSV